MHQGMLYVIWYPILHQENIYVILSIQFNWRTGANIVGKNLKSANDSFYIKFINTNDINNMENLANINAAKFHGFEHRGRSTALSTT